MSNIDFDEFWGPVVEEHKVVKKPKKLKFKYSREQVFKLMRDSNASWAVTAVDKETDNVMSISKEAPETANTMVDTLVETVRKEKQGKGGGNLKRLLCDFLYTEVEKVTFEQLQRVYQVLTTSIGDGMLRFFLIDVAEVNGITRLSELLTRLDLYWNLNILKEIVKCFQATLSSDKGVNLIVRSNEVCPKMIRMLLDSRIMDLGVKMKIMEFLILLMGVDAPKDRAVVRVVKSFELIFENDDVGKRNKMDQMIRLVVDNGEDLVFVNSCLMFMNVILHLLKDKRVKMELYKELFACGFPIFLKNLEIFYSDKKEKFPELEIQLSTFRAELQFSGQDKSVALEVVKKLYISLDGKTAYDSMVSIHQNLLGINSRFEGAEDQLNERWAIIAKIVESLACGHASGGGAGGGKLGEAVFGKLNEIQTQITDRESGSVRFKKQIEKFLHLLDERGLDEIYEKDISTNENDITLKMFRKIREIIRTNAMENEDEVAKLTQKLTDIHTASSNENDEETLKDVGADDSGDDDSDDEDFEAPPPPDVAGMDAIHYYEEFKITQVFKKYKDEQKKVLRMRPLKTRAQEDSIFFHKNLAKTCHSFLEPELLERLDKSFFPRENQNEPKRVFKKKLVKYLVGDVIAHKAALSLRTINLKYDDIVKYIKLFRTSKLTVDEVEKIRGILPKYKNSKGVDEVSRILKNADEVDESDVSSLHKIDKFMLALLGMQPPVHERLGTWVFFKLRCKELTAEVHSQLDCLLNACELVIGNESFLQFLSLVLAVANVLCHHKTPVYSFTLTSLAQLSLVKSCVGEKDDKASVLQFIVEYLSFSETSEGKLERKSNQALAFIDDFKRIVANVKDLEFGMVKNNFDNLKRGVAQMKKLYEHSVQNPVKGDEMPGTLKLACSKTENEVKVVLGDKYNKLNKFYEKLEGLFGEDKGRLVDCTFWKELNDFLLILEKERRACNLKLRKEEHKEKRIKIFNQGKDVPNDRIRTSHEMAMIQESFKNGRFRVHDE